MEKGFLKRAADSVCQKIISFYREHRIAAVFISLISLGFFAYLVGVLIGGDSVAMNPFFVKGDDLFMDFYNSVRDASLGVGNYTERYVIYPPMASLIMLVFSRFMPAGYLATAFSQRELWIYYPSAFFAFLLYMGVPVVLLLLFCYRAYRKGNHTRALLAATVLLSFPVLFSVERGNILILAVLATLYYVLNYNSESRVRRELALLALAFAFSLKLYPALLGLPLLVDKRYKDGIRCAIYAILMFFLPSFFFGGPQCIIWILQNLGRFSAERHAFWGWPFAGSALATVADYLPCLFAALLFVASSLLRMERYKVWTIGISVLYAFPSLNAGYAWTFYLAPLLLLFAVEQPKKIDWAYAILMMLPFAVLGIAPVVAWQVLATVCLFALLLLAAVDVVRALRARRKPEAAE